MQRAQIAAKSPLTGGLHRAMRATASEPPVTTRRLFDFRPRGGVVTQRPAKPCTPVRFRPWPPYNIMNLFSYLGFKGCFCRLNAHLFIIILTTHDFNWLPFRPRECCLPHPWNRPPLGACGWVKQRTSRWQTASKAPEGSKNRTEEWISCDSGASRSSPSWRHHAQA